ncbi:hypothetical protein Acid345_0286 [Candidatus Koribacter versatilis Ellin345]|uniref:Uncharacterized protein n=1 Tax=Koribacter versatilis (strain Ellin345) TaxID=204669 RepID=Q1IV09_KORVE|nr:hypothetical protein [Candidatus Koribacter versatilis]ABF39291.1 hypothetical protein Acid345_0286 [Candidatus Koribacter versatilis Ellin345]
MRKQVATFVVLVFVAAAVLGGVCAWAQEPQDQQGPPPQSAGGRWSVFQSEDRMTGAKLVQFELESDNTMPDSDRRSRVVLFCKNGHYENAEFQPSIRMAGPNRPGFWGQPQMQVRVRADAWHDDKGWNWLGKALSMDKGSVQRAMGARVFRVEFLAARKKASAQPYIAEFSPEGLNFSQVKASCDLGPKH